MTQRGLVLRVALGTAVAAFVAAAVAAGIGVSTRSVDTAVLIRSGLITASVFTWVSVVARRHADQLDVHELRRGCLLGLLLGFVLNPFGWVGRSYLGQLWFDPGVLTVLIDLTAWGAVGGATLWLVTRAAVARPTAAHHW